MALAYGYWQWTQKIVLIVGYLEEVVSSYFNVLSFMGWTWSRMTITRNPNKKCYWKISFPLLLLPSKSKDRVKLCMENCQCWVGGMRWGGEGSFEAQNFQLRSHISHFNVSNFSHTHTQWKRRKSRLRRHREITLKKFQKQILRFFERKKCLKFCHTKNSEFCTFLKQFLLTVNYKRMNEIPEIKYLLHK